MVKRRKKNGPYDKKMANGDDDGQLIWLWSAISFSIVGDSLLILTYFLNSEWAKKMSSAKDILVSQCILELLGYISLLGTPIRSDSAICAFQACCGQIFIEGSVCMNGILAIEMALICREAFGPRRLQGTTNNPRKKKEKEHFRLKMYLLFYLIFCLSNIIYILAEKAYALTGYNDSNCWFATDSQMLYLGYSFIWASMGIGIIAIIYTVTTINGVIADLERNAITLNSLLQNENGETTAKTKKTAALSENDSAVRGAYYDERSVKYKSLQNTFRRLEIDAFFFILMWIPGSIIRGSAGRVDSPLLVILGYIGWSYGFWKAMIWIIFDTKVREFWFITLKEFCDPIWIFLGCTQIVFDSPKTAITASTKSDESESQASPTIRSSTQGGRGGDFELRKSSQIQNPMYKE